MCYKISGNGFTNEMTIIGFNWKDMWHFAPSSNPLRLDDAWLKTVLHSIMKRKIFLSKTIKYT